MRFATSRRDRLAQLALTGTKKPALPLCDPRLAARPAVLSRISIRTRWPRAPRAPLRRLANHGYARAFQSRQILFGIHLALRRNWLFCFDFARRLRQRIFFLRRLARGCELSLGWRLSLGRR